MTHLPRKRFGQHFLCDQAVIERIVACIAPHPREHLIEIGPGQGALTLPLLKRLRYLEAIELDRDLITELEVRTRHAGELKLYSADAMAFDYASIKTDDRMLRVVGNLPYNISTPLMFHLLSYADIIKDMVFMLQKEVALRLAAKCSTPDYGRLSVMVQYHCQVDLLFDVPPSAFFPPPKVDSSIIKLTPYRKKMQPVKDYFVFESVVKQAFSQRRKTLRNTLKNTVDDAMWERLQIDSTKRAENLTTMDFIKIANALMEK